MSTTAAFWIESRRPTAPKSMRPEGAVGEHEDVARVGIGVEEPGPQHLVERRVQQPVGQCLPVDAPLVELLASLGRAALEALLHEEPAGAAARGGPAGCGPGTGRRGARAISSMASASRRKSSSARRLTANWATISPDRMPLADGVRRWATWATRDKGGEVALHQVLDPGALDLHHHRSPVRSRARCVWPIDAAASGSQSNSANTSSTARRARLRARPGSPPRLGRDLVLQLASASATSGGTRSTRVAAIWPSLMYTPPASSSTVRRRTRRPRRRRPPGARGGEAVASKQASSSR